MTRRERHEGGELDTMRGQVDDAERLRPDRDLVVVPGGMDDADDSLDARLRAALMPMLNEPVPEEFLRIIAPLKAR
jgi:hypothetical protein